MSFFCVIFVTEKETNTKNKVMELITDIFIYMTLTVIFCLSTGIFVQTSKEMWENFKEDYPDWGKNTGIGMWLNNRKNGVTILTEEEYENLRKSGKIIPIEVVED